MDEKKLIINNSLVKNFSYTKGEVSLVFSLQIDTKEKLIDFKGCLEIALEEISEEIEKN